MENNSNFISMLRLIYAKAELGELVKNGLRYSQISQLLKQGVEAGYISAHEGSFNITKKGLDLIHKKRSKEYPDGGWITPLKDAQVKKIKPMDIYLPNKATARKLVTATSASGLHHREGESSS